MRQRSLMRRLAHILASLLSIALLAAAAAPAASAAGELTAEEYPFTIDGTDLAEAQNALTLFGMAVECEDSSYGAEAVGGGSIEAPADEFTMVPGYNNPKCKAEELKATVKANGCDFVLHIGEEGEAGEFALITDLVCPVGKVVEVLVYLSPTNENILGCRVTIAAQSGLSGASAEATGGTVQVSGTIDGISATQEGLCGEEATSKAQYDLAIQLSGTDGSQDPVDLDLEKPGEPPTLNSDGPVTLDIEEQGVEENVFEMFGEKVECPGSIYTGHKYDATPHELIAVPATTITITPHYNQETCESGAGLPMTIDVPNDCDFVLHVGEEIANGEYAVTTDIECTEGGKIAMTVFAGDSHSFRLCTMSIGTQTGLTGPTLSNAEGDLNINGTFTGIHMEQSGLCGTGTESGAELSINATIEGTNAEGGPTAISVTGGGE